MGQSRIPKIGQRTGQMVLIVGRKTLAISSLAVFMIGQTLNER